MQIHSIHSIYEVKTIAEGMDHPECLAFHPDGTGYAGGEAGQLYRFDLDGAVAEVANTGGGIGGLCLDGTGAVFECNYGLSRVHRVGTDGTVTVVSEGGPELSARLPNFPVFDGQGHLFFSDSGDFYKANGRIFRVRPGGATEAVVAGGLQFPNGMAVSPDGKWLYVIQSSASNILRYPLANGELGDPEIYITLPGTVPDGLAFSEHDHLYVACYTPDMIYRITPDRVADTLVFDPYADRLNRPTNVAFAPNRTLLCFANLGGGGIHAVDVGEKGVPLHYPKW